MHHIEIWQSPPRIGDQRWHWHLKSKGRVVTDAESFPSKGNAIRAAKAVVRGIINAFPGKEIYFTEEKKGDMTIIRWGGMAP